MATAAPHQPVDRRGYLLLVGAALGFSLMSVAVKLGGELLPVEMLVLARGVVTLVMSYSWLRLRRISPWGVDRRRLLLRGVLGLGGLACFFTAVTRLPLAEVTVIHYLNPLFTALLAALLLGEAMGAVLWVVLALGIFGTLLVAQPAQLLAGTGSLDPIGLACALGGALFSAGAYTTVRRLARTDNPHVIVFYFPVVAVPATLPFAVRAWVWPTPRGWLLMLAIGVATQLAQVALTRGLALVPAGRGTATGYVQIVFAAFWGLIIFGERPSGWTFGGAAVIVVATILLTRSR